MPSPPLMCSTRIDVWSTMPVPCSVAFRPGELTDEQYDRIVQLNQTSVVEVTRALLPMLRAAGQAAIVNTVSISALTGGSPGSAIYSASKAFVATYFEGFLRAKLAPDGIRVNCVSPGTIATDFQALLVEGKSLNRTAAAPSRCSALGTSGRLRACAISSSPRLRSPATSPDRCSRSTADSLSADKTDLFWCSATF